MSDWKDTKGAAHNCMSSVMSSSQFIPLQGRQNSKINCKSSSTIRALQMTDLHGQSKNTLICDKSLSRSVSASGE